MEPFSVDLVVTKVETLSYDTKIVEVTAQATNTDDAVYTRSHLVRLRTHRTRAPRVGQRVRVLLTDAEELPYPTHDVLGNPITHPEDVDP